jgi:O-antigen/teichoic acid export membrane protein
MVRIWPTGTSPTPIILAQQAWQAGAGLVTVACIALFLTPAQQGWYYTLVSLAALSTLLEFGLLAVLGQRAARFFLVLQWEDGVPNGRSADLFIALAGWSLRVFTMLALTFIVVFGPAGFLFLVRSAAEPVAWHAIFVSLIFATALGLLPQPLLALIEGSGRVASLYACRLMQGVAGSLLLWALLASGAGLWAVLAPALAAFLVPVAVLIGRYRSFLALTLRTARQAPSVWQEVWPLQWRVGLSQLAAYLTTQIATPILFAMEGADAAGQMGLSLTLCTMLGLVARASFTGHVPAMTQAAARHDWPALDRFMRDDLVWFVVVFAVGGLLLIMAELFLANTSLGGRLLPLPVFLAVLITVLAMAIHTMLAAQLRAFGQEPLLVIAIAGACLTVACMGLAASRWGSAGVAGAMAFVQCFFVLPASIWLWRRFHGLRRDANTLADHRHPDL